MKENGSLSGKTCLIMRNASQAKPLIDGISKLGGHSILVPLISFKKKNLDEQETKMMKNLSSYNWIVFTSQNGVRFFMDELKEQNLSFPEKLKIAAVGTKTKKLLNDYGLSISIVPKKFTGDVLADEMKQIITSEDRICIVKGNLSRDIVGKVLAEAGAKVESIINYETYLPEESKTKLWETVKTEKLDILIFTSPSTVDHFVQILGTSYLNFVGNKWIACIGPVTKKALEKYAIPVQICPENYTIEQLLDDMNLFFSKQ